MNVTELKDLKIYDFLPIDIVYKDWNIYNFGAETKLANDNIIFNHKRYIKRFPPAWTDNDTIYLKEEDGHKYGGAVDSLSDLFMSLHDMFNKEGELRVREYVDEFPRQEVQNYADKYVDGIDKKERPSMSEDNKRNFDDDKNFKLKSALKSWGTLYEDYLDNVIDSKKKEESNFVPQRIVRKREYSPLEDEHLSEFISEFAFTPTDRRTVQYLKTSNSWEIKSGEYEFNERIIKGGKNKKWIGGIFTPEVQKKNWGGKEEKYTHNELVRNIKIEGQLTEHQYNELSNNNMNNVLTNFNQSQTIDRDPNSETCGKLKTAEPLKGYVTFGAIYNKKLTNQSDPYSYANQWPLFNKDYPDDSPEQEFKHKNLVTYPMKWDNKEWSQNHENTYENFYRRENLMQLNPFTYKLDHEYYTKDFMRFSEKIKEQKYYEKKFEIDFRSQEDISAGDNFRWDMIGDHGYSKLSTGGQRGNVKTQPKTKDGDRNLDYTGDTIKGIEEKEGGTSQTQGDFLDFAVYREQVQFVNEPARTNVDQYTFNGNTNTIQGTTYDHNMHKPYQYNLDSSMCISQPLTYQGTGKPYDKNGGGGAGNTLTSESGQTKEAGRDLVNGVSGVKTALSDGAEDFQDIFVLTRDDYLKDLKRFGKLDTPFQPDFYAKPGQRQISGDTSGNPEVVPDEDNRQNISVVCNYFVDTTDQMVTSNCKKSNQNDPNKNKYIQWIKDLQMVRNPKIIDFGQDNYRKRWDLHNEYFEEWNNKVMYYDMYGIRPSRRDEKNEVRYDKVEQRKRQVEWENLTRFNTQHKGEKFFWADRKQVWKEPGLEEVNNYDRQLNRHSIHAKEEFYDTIKDVSSITDKMQNWYKSNNWQYMFNEREHLEKYDLNDGRSVIKTSRVFWFKTQATTGCEPRGNDNFPYGVGKDECTFQYRTDEKVVNTREKRITDSFDEVVFYYKDIYAAAAGQCTPLKSDCKTDDCYGDKKRPCTRHQFSDKKDVQRTDYWEIVDKKDSWKKKPFEFMIPPTKEHTHYVYEVHKMRPNPDNKSRDEFYGEVEQQTGIQEAYQPTGPLKESEKETPHYGSIFKDHKIQYYDMSEWKPDCGIDNVLTKRNIGEAYNQLLTAKISTVTSEHKNWYNKPCVPLDLKKAGIYKTKMEQCMGSGKNEGEGDDDEKKRGDWWDEQGKQYYDNKSDERVFYINGLGSIYRKLRKLRQNLDGDTTPVKPSVQEQIMEEVSTIQEDLIGDQYPTTIAWKSPTCDQHIYLKETNKKYLMEPGIKKNIFLTDSISRLKKTSIMHNRQDEYSCMQPAPKKYWIENFWSSMVPPDSEPKSDYLFVFVSDKQSHLITDKVWENKWYLHHKPEDNYIEQRTTVKENNQTKGTNDDAPASTSSFTEGITSAGVETNGEIREYRKINSKYHIYNDLIYTAREKDITYDHSYTQDKKDIKLKKTIKATLGNYVKETNITQNRTITETYNQTAQQSYIRYTKTMTQEKSLTIKEKYTSNQLDVNRNIEYNAYGTSQSSTYGYTGKVKSNVVTTISSPGQQSNQLHVRGTNNGSDIITVDGSSIAEYNVTVTGGGGKCSISLRNGVINIDQTGPITVKSGTSISLIQPVVSIITNLFTVTAPTSIISGSLTSGPTTTGPLDPASCTLRCYTCC